MPAMIATLSVLCVYDADDKEGKRWVTERGLLFEFLIVKWVDLK